MKKYNVKEIMKAAWEIRRSGGMTMSEAMKTAWSVAKIKVGVSPMDDKVQEYFRRLEAADKAMKALEEIKAEIQAACLESPDFCISGFSWNASYKPVTSNRLDSKALKADHADIYAAYTKAQTSRRFLCKPEQEHLKYWSKGRKYVKMAGVSQKEGKIANKVPKA